MSTAIPPWAHFGFFLSGTRHRTPSSAYSYPREENPNRTPTRNSRLKIVGHRGARGLAPENTLAAIRKGLEHGVDELEIDVRVSKDNVPVLHHDKALRDPNGKKLPIAAHQFAELKAHKPDLATLEQAILEVRRLRPLYLEIKPGAPVAPITRVLHKCLTHGCQTGDFLLASFSFRTLKQLDKKLPGIEKIVNENWSGARGAYRARRLRAKRITMYYRALWPGFIRPMARRGYQLYAFPLNDPSKAREWHKLGLAGVITDYPDRFPKPPARQTSVAPPPAAQPKPARQPAAQKPPRKVC